MIKFIARKPIPRMKPYLKYGYVITEHTYYHCPRCGLALNARPNYQPKYCGQCGQRISYAGIEWRQDKEMGIVCVPFNTKLVNVYYKQAISKS